MNILRQFGGNGFNFGSSDPNVKVTHESYASKAGNSFCGTVHIILLLYI